jgi:Domain of unknown function (DUF4157)
MVGNAAVADAMGRMLAATPGRPVERRLQSLMTSRLGQQFDNVEIHTDGAAADSARTLGARAYTLGRRVVFAPGEYSPGTTDGRRLLAHELAHVVQQRRGGRPVEADRSSANEGEARAAASAVVAGQSHAVGGGSAVGIARETPAPAQAPTARDERPLGAEQPAAATSPAQLPAGRYKVILVGAPGRAEVKAQHPLQFAKAAALSGTDENTIWLVERTGYQLGKVPESDVIAQAGKARVFWVEPAHGLVAALQTFPPHSIERMEAYGHGVPGLLAMRHGWDEPDYGLSAADAKGLTPDAFMPDATISFESCNSAAVAQAVADATERPARGWAGRTTYHDVNEGTGGVKASEIFPESGGFDYKEAWSQFLAPPPHQETYAPSKSSGDFESYFSMSARLPGTRDFDVRVGGTVSATVKSDTKYDEIAGGKMTVILHRKEPWYERDDDVDPIQELTIRGEATFTWRGLEQGTYYVELFHLSGLTVKGTISITIR